MTENQNEQKNLQHENLQKENKKAEPYTRDFWLEFFIAVIIVGFFMVIFMSGGRVDIFIITVAPIVLVAMISIGSVIFAYIAKFCLGIFFARELAGGTTRWAAYIFRCSIFAIIAFTVFTIYDNWLNPPGHGVEASNIVSNLRSLQSASLMLYEDKGELIHELPRGVNIAEYLTRYMRNPDSSVWSKYMFIIADNGYWWVGGLYVGTSRRGRAIRNRLAGRAHNVGLFGTSQPEPPLSADRAYQYQTNDAFVWMLIRVPAVDETNYSSRYETSNRVGI